MSLIFSLLAGVIFGAGLTLSDMVNPARVLNFLDVAGGWDPTLIFVMAGGLAVTTLGYRLIFRRSSPVFGDKFNLPTQRQIDLPLVGGRRAVWRGVGPCWHLPRPGPRRCCDIGAQSLAVWCRAMLVGMIVASAWRDKVSARKAMRQPQKLQT